MRKIITKESTKYCTSCNMEKNIKREFYRANAKYYRSECKSCFCKGQSERSREYYYNHRKKYLARNLLARKRRAESMEEFKAARPCAECGPQPPHRLTFDRPDGKKRFNIARDLKDVLAGTSAFQVVCLNCVADRAFKRERVASVMKAMKVR